MHLEVKDLHVHYGKIEAIKGVSIFVNEGEIVTLIGANGAGKTTMLKTISGLRPASSGQIIFNGEDISSQLLLSGEIVLDWILSLVLDGDGVFFWFSDSHGPKVKNLAVVLSYGNDWRNLEGFSLDFDHFNILFDVEALRVFNLKLDLRLEFVLLFCLEDDFDDLLLAWLQSSAGVGNFEFLAQCINS